MRTNATTAGRAWTRAIAAAAGVLVVVAVSLVAPTAAVASSHHLTAVSITPRESVIGQGRTLQFHATGTYSDGSTRDLTTIVTWSTAETALVTVSNTPGSQGLVTATGDGGQGFGTLGYAFIHATLTVHHKVITGVTAVSIEFVNCIFGGPIPICI